LKYKKINKVLFVTVLCLFQMVSGRSSPSHSENLKELITPLLKSNNLIKSAEAGLKAAKEGAKAARGGMFPTATITSHYGYEKQNKTSGTDNTDLIPRKADISVNQLVWDFGATNATIKSAKLAAKGAQFGLISAKQATILGAITSYLNLDASAKALKYARESENNIKRQTELENSLVKKGAGLSSDVLQAKATLAGAMARRVGAELALALARNAYRKAFQTTDPADLSAIERPNFPSNAIPGTLEEAIEIALRKNPGIRAASMGAAAAKEGVKVARASSLFPKFDITAAAGWKDNDGGAIGHQEDRSAKLNMSFPFNLGFTAINTIKAAKYGVSAVQNQVKEARDATENLVRDTWANMNMTKQNFKFLANQATISAEFLELARKERKAGNKTLLDILGGETALINAKSDAAAAESAVLTMGYTLLGAMGILELSHIQ
jgi:outer membrane protein, adhesin transport system